MYVDELFALEIKFVQFVIEWLWLFIMCQQMCEERTTDVKFVDITTDVSLE